MCVSGGVSPGGVCVPRGCMSPGGVCPQGVCEAHPWTQSEPLPCGQTNSCENITLPQTSFSGGNKLNDIINSLRTHFHVI